MKNISRNKLKSNSQLKGWSDENLPKSAVLPLLVDLYHVTMAYGFWKSNKLLDYAVFELTFRKNPFGGEYTIFAGLEEALKFVKYFKFERDDIKYLKRVMPPDTNSQFYEYLESVTTNQISVYAQQEGNVVFPKVPLIRVEGPLIVVQLLETGLLNLINFASLVATNAARYRIAAGDVQIFEMGTRRAQGPDGALSATKYCYMGGCDCTSNCLAGKLFKIPIQGTVGHSYISAFRDFSDLKDSYIRIKDTDQSKDLLKLSKDFRGILAGSLDFLESETNDGELAAFVSYAISFPNNFVALIDTYEVRKSGLYNFCAVALALNDFKYTAIGIRIDSGDLAYLSVFTREIFKKVSQKFKLPWFLQLKIIVSSNLNEQTIYR